MTDTNLLLHIHKCIKDEAEKLASEAKSLPSSNFKDTLNDLADSFFRLAARILDI